MKLAAGALLVLCVSLQAARARADGPRRLILDPPRLLLGAANPAATQDEGLSESQIGWLAFGADALLQVGTSFAETGFFVFGASLLNGTPSNGGEGLISLVVVGLMLAVHPALDAFLVDAIARLSHSRQPSFAGSLVGSYLGCLLGLGGFVLAFSILEAWPVLQIVVASLVNALIPAATTVLAERLFQSKTDSSPTTLPGNAVARVEPPRDANEPAWRSGLADPVARWAF